MVSFFVVVCLLVVDLEEELEPLEEPEDFDDPEEDLEELDDFEPDELEPLEVLFDEAELRELDAAVVASEVLPVVVSPEVLSVAVEVVTVVLGFVVASVSFVFLLHAENAVAIIVKAAITAIIFIPFIYISLQFYLLCIKKG